MPSAENACHADHQQEAGKNQVPFNGYLHAQTSCSSTLRSACCPAESQLPSETHSSSSFRPSTMAPTMVASSIRPATSKGSSMSLNLSLIHIPSPRD